MYSLWWISLCYRWDEDPRPRPVGSLTSFTIIVWNCNLASSLRRSFIFANPIYLAIIRLNLLRCTDFLVWLWTCSNYHTVELMIYNMTQQLPQNKSLGVLLSVYYYLLPTHSETTYGGYIVSIKSCPRLITRYFCLWFGVFYSPYNIYCLWGKKKVYSLPIILNN